MRKRITIAAVLLAIVLAIALPFLTWKAKPTTPVVRQGRYLREVLPDLRRSYDDIKASPYSQTLRLTECRTVISCQHD
jgi:hypothetical protein